MFGSWQVTGSYGDLPPLETTMEQQALRFLIQRKLADGRLPHDSIPRVWGGPGNGETCDACEDIILKEQFGMELPRVRRPFNSTSNVSTSGTRCESCQGRDGTSQGPSAARVLGTIRPSPPQATAWGRR
jgi:hypothetical protein